MNVFDALREKGIDISPEQEKLIMDSFNSKINYTPKVGVFGKTGAGKSSLCNALFGKKMCDVSDVEACTRETKSVDIGGINLIDCPGVGESNERDREYKRAYDNLLPTLDAILWVLKGDDRAFTVDKQFYDLIISNKAKEKLPFFFVVNQVDKIEPFRKWNEEAHRPGEEQEVNINKKREYISSVFSYPINKVIAVSANEGYNLVELVNTLVLNLPQEKQAMFYTTFKEELRTEETTEKVKKNTENTFWNTVAKYTKIAAEIVIPIILSKIPVIGPIAKVFKFFR